MSCKYRQTPNQLFTGALEVYRSHSTRIWGSCNTGMQCCGQAALCPLCRQHSLGLCCVPTVLSTALWKHLSAFLCLSFYPHDLWTNGPIAGTRSKRGGALWDKLVLQMGKRDTQWHKRKSYGRNFYPKDRSLFHKICALPYGRDQSAVAPYQGDKSWRHKSAENQTVLMEMLKSHFWANYTCVLGFLFQPDPSAVAERKPGQRCISDEAGPTLPYPGKVTRALAVS